MHRGRLARRGISAIDLSDLCGQICLDACKDVEKEPACLAAWGKKDIWLAMNTLKIHAVTDGVKGWKSCSGRSQDRDMGMHLQG